MYFFEGGRVVFRPILALYMELRDSMSERLSIVKKNPVNLLSQHLSFF